MTASVSTDCYLPGQAMPDLSHAFAAVTDLHDVVGSVKAWIRLPSGPIGWRQALP
jgi:hypothetical protein